VAHGDGAAVEVADVAVQPQILLAREVPDLGLAFRNKKEYRFTPLHRNE